MEGERIEIIAAAPPNRRHSRRVGLDPAPAERHTRTMSGQALVLFTLAIFVIMGLIGLVIDVSWYWANTLRLQRAADAAALAGAVQLPGNKSAGYTLALAEAKKNGYDIGGTAYMKCVNTPPVLVEPADKKLEICAQQDQNQQQMDVGITAPVGTFFMKIFGINAIQATVSAQALFSLPVPMGSPDNYYGNFGPIRYSNGTATQTLSGPGALCPNGLVDCYQGTGGQLLAPRGFWGTMLSQGDDPLNGDAYMPIGSGTRYGSNPQNTTNFYDYSIWAPPSSTGVQVYIFDPGFCSTNSSGQYGTGDRWMSGTASQSSYYDLFADPSNTPYVLSDDPLIGTSGTLFQDQNFSDSTQGGSGGTTCTQKATKYSGPGADGRDYHDRWWKLPLAGAYASGLTGAPVTGTTYRLRTTTDPNYQAAVCSLPYPAGPACPSLGIVRKDQNSVQAQNSFAIYIAAGSQGTPQVYGQGAMEMYTPLPGGGAARFFLAQIDANVGSNGKTMRINLWDPGDTNQLSATMKVLEPCDTTGTTQPACSGTTVSVCQPGDPTCAPSTMWTYMYAKISALSATRGVNDGNASCPTNAANASANAANGLGFPTNSGGGSTGLYNGCWVTIDVPIPANYGGTAKMAPDLGWWMIEYDMGGSSSQSAFDLTSWQVNVVGNPVHLIVP
jgi:hypothetical protein